MSNQAASARLITNMLHSMTDEPRDLADVATTMETCLHGLWTFLQESNTGLTLRQALNLLLLGVSSPLVPGSQYNGVDYAGILGEDGPRGMCGLGSIEAILANSDTHLEYGGLNLDTPLAEHDFGYDLLTADQPATA